MVNSKQVSKLATRRELADVFGVHMMTVTKWERDGLPIAELGRKGKPSRYRVADCMQWFVAREVKARGGGDEQISPQHEKALLDRKRREELELKIEVRRGELVEAADAARDFAECAAAVKARLRRIPDAVADRVLKVTDAHAVKALLLAEIDEALSELSARAQSDDVEEDDAA
jgi:phage terminase Nu1 subunit (DNA packaging protein)